MFNSPERKGHGSVGPLLTSHCAGQVCCLLDAITKTPLSEPSLELYIGVTGTNSEVLYGISVTGERNLDQWYPMLGIHEPLCHSLRTNSGSSSVRGTGMFAIPGLIIT